MSKDVFLLCFLVGSALLAAWVAVRFPRLGPASLTWAFFHIGLTFGVGLVLGPGMALVAGDGRVLLALFAVGLPAVTYMFLAGIWLLRVTQSSLPR
jgi:hypothetical protein